MPNYHWTGINEAGERKKGLLFANSTGDLRQKLFEQKIAIFSCQESDRRTQRFLPAVGGIIPHRKVTLQQKASFFHDMSIILDSGIPLLQALNLAQKYTSSKSMRRKIETLIETIERGHRLSKAMEITKFAPLTVHIIRSGEQSGKLAESFKQLSVDMSKKAALTQKLRQASLAPTITIIFAMGTVITVALFIVPQLKPFFNSVGSKDATSGLLFTLSDFMKSEAQQVIIICTLTAIFLAIQVARLFSKKNVCLKPIHRWKDRIILSIPLIGKMVTLTNLINFTNTLCLLLKTGNHALQSVEIAGNTCSNTHISKNTKKIALNLERGQTLSSAFLMANKDYRKILFPDFFIESVALGEKTGNLTTMLKKCSQLFEKKLFSKITLLTALFQPIMLVGVGIFIAFLLMSLDAPLFNLGEHLGKAVS